jgi:hypothetical protein
MIPIEFLLVLLCYILRLVKSDRLVGGRVECENAIGCVCVIDRLFHLKVYGLCPWCLLVCAMYLCVFVAI